MSILFGTVVSFLLGGMVSVAEPIPYVKPMERFAFSAIGVVRTLGPKSAVICSGTLVAQDLVITSAHCVEKYKGLMQRVDFAAGQTGTRSVAVSGAAEIIQHPVWSYASGVGRYLYDVAVIRLARPISEERVRSFDLFPEGTDLTGRAALLGYQAEQQSLLRGRFDCLLAAKTRNGLYTSDCAASRGNSGGAVLARSGSQWQLAGVIVASDNDDGSALVVKIDEWLRDHVESARKREIKRAAASE